MAFPVPAEAACAGNVQKTTGATKTYVAGTLTHWTSVSQTAGTPCSDINVVAVDTIHNCRGAYYSEVQDKWVNGASGWMYCAIGVVTPVVTSISGTGIDFRTGSNYASMKQKQLT